MASQLDPQVNVIYLGVLDASATPVRKVFVAPCVCTVMAVSLVNGTGISKNGTNKGTYTVKNGANIVATKSTSVDAIVADVVWPLTMTATTAYKLLAAGDVLILDVAEGGTPGTGDLDAEAVLSVEWVPGSC